MQKIHGRWAAAGIGMVALVALAGCESAGQERIFDRGQELAQIFAEPFREPTEAIPVLSGTASYTGVASGSFDGIDSPFTALADLDLTADFTDRTLRGSMSNWVSDDPEDYRMRGDVLIGDGRIYADGTFDGLLSGNVSREPTARKQVQLREAGEDPVRYVQQFFGFGDVAGSFHDSTLTGERAAVVVGEFEGGGVTGFFGGRAQQ